MLTLTVAQMKNAERLADENGLSYGRMMENAGTAAFRYLKERHALLQKKCVILAGAGNNAGDGFVIARKMLEEGCVPVVLLCCGEPKSELARANFALYTEKKGIVIDAAEDPQGAERALSQAGLVIDGIFGTGFRGELAATAAGMVALANAGGAERVALDIPSGMDADSGHAGEVCFRAGLTLSFAAFKPAHHNAESGAYCGRVEVLDIGIPADTAFAAAGDVRHLTAEYIQGLLPVRRADSHKGDYGNLLLIAGSNGMGGAAMMATLAALRSGAGKTTLASTATVVRSAAASLMEAMTLSLPEADGAIDGADSEQLERALHNATACMLGCGLSVTEGTKRLVTAVIEGTECPLVLDADALNILAEQPELLKRAARPPILTPHPGEMARLCGMTTRQIVENPMSAARLFAREYGCVVVLKGHRTVIAVPNGAVYVNTTGNAGLAKGGSGDVLAGMIAGLLAQGIPTEAAALCGVYLHGRCADRLAERMSQYSILARDVIAELPALLKELGR